VSEIPDQNVAAGGIFTPIALDDYVSDIDNADAELEWSVIGNVSLTVSITDRVALISAPAGWAGTETLTFSAKDPGNAFAEDAASFTVRAPNQAPVVYDIPDQTIAEGGTSPSIDLDEYVNDPDNDDPQLTWTYSVNTDLVVSITTIRVASISAPDSNWNGSETITFPRRGS
jgi:hypothetical protein